MNLFRITILTLAFWLYFTRLPAQEPTADFSHIAIDQQGTVILSASDRCEVQLADSGKNDSHYEISNGTFTLKSRSNKTVAHVQVRNLKSVVISGRGTVKAENTFNAGKLDLKISGYGTIEMPVDADEVVAAISGKGHITLSGKARHLYAQISGAGKVNSSDLKSTETNVDISGAGKVSTDVTDNLDIHISGVGSVTYVNAPKNISKQISGIGKVGSADGGESSDRGQSDTTLVTTGDKTIMIIGNDNENDVQIDVQDGNDHKSTWVKYHRGGKTQGHWGGFELGFNNYFTDGFNSGLPDEYDFLELNTGKSVAVNLNLFDWKFNIVKHHLGLVTGVGITWNNWRFQGDRTLIANAPAVAANFDSIDYSKNKLTASYVTLPLLLEFNTSAREKNTFHVGTGIVGGYRIGSHTKQKFKENDKTRKVKTYDDFNLNPYRADATVRIGYRGFTFFASYGLLTLFKNDEGPELFPFTFGLTLVDW